MLFSSQNCKDIERYFHGTWIKLPVDAEAGHLDPDLLIRVDRVNRDYVQGIGEDDSRYVIHLSGDPELAFNVDYILPHKSYFVHNNNACLLTRVPARQYKRGLCSENTEVYQLTSKEGFNKLEITVDLLKSYTRKPAFSTLAEVAQGGKSSFALAPRFAIALDGNIFCDTTRIGRFNPKERVIYTRHKLFETDLKKLCGDYVRGVIVGTEPDDE